MCEFNTPRKALGELQPSDPVIATTRPMEGMNNQMRPTNEKANKTSISKGLSRSKSVAFDLECEEML